MNEYRVPELNVQNGVLNALSFLFEYIGEMEKDYVYAASPGDFGLNLRSYWIQTGSGSPQDGGTNLYVRRFYKKRE